MLASRSQSITNASNSCVNPRHLRLQDRRVLAGVQVPTIVFHGDADRTVNERNGIDIVQDATARGTPASPLHEHATAGAVEGGRAFTRTVFTDAASRPRAEYWRIHGAGHAWSGGSASGSYTDPKGPDASAEMVRFFLQQPAPGMGAP
jgi:poly(3-hydroxybutyrate) depolymerase